jgi:glucose/arabinose dehydrogenase
VIRPRTGALALALLAAITLSCSSSDGDDDAGTTSSVATTSTTHEPPGDDRSLDDIDLALTEIATLEEPTALTYQPGSLSLFVAERAGRVRLIRVTVSSFSGERRHEVDDEPILDISDEVTTTGEQGLLGLTFSSDGRKLFVSYNSAVDGRTHLDEYTMDRFDPDEVDTDTRRTLLTVEQPFANHKGGDVHIGPDGFLYLGLGDGGSQHDPDGRGQRTDTLLAKLLRIDPERPDGGRPYAIPDGNPFADGGDGAPEIFLLGVRNPWRFSFDRETDDLWIGDVGQNEWEEIDLLPAADGGGVGANLGWDLMEGRHGHEGGENPEGGVLPIFEYSHDDGGCAVVGGYVYRGTAIPALADTYLFADYCLGGIRGLRVKDGRVVDTRTWQVRAQQVISFGEGPDGEVYVLTQTGAMLRVDQRSNDDDATTTSARVEG